MKHRVKFRKLGRDSAHRIAMLRNQTDSLIEYERIQTTVAKAKELRGFVDYVISLGRKGTLHNRTAVKATLRRPEMVEKVFGPLAERYKYRPSGFTRILKTGFRKGDSADMCVIELVDRPGELRPAKPCDEETLKRAQRTHEIALRDLIGSRDFKNKMKR
mmetsp:Transcript_1063/g.1720  ORF Transcript_1063/g.1720 Transcript_1063/m.1720 type:complete len:160 (-) Transcript_1063:851-1330(-)